MNPRETPADLGFRMPAEWAPHHGIWLAWPTEDSDDFSGVHREPVLDMYSELIGVLLESGHVYLNNGPVAARSGLLGEFGERHGERLHFLDIPSSEWCRDFGPTFLLDGEKTLGAVNWNFTVWGGKYGETFSADARATGLMAGHAGARCFRAEGICLEGGAIDVNGAGAALTTESCLLHANRNAGVSKDEIATQLREFLGIDQIIWLDGSLTGDDTDGHIDTMARFVSETAIAVQTFGPDDENYPVSRENLGRLHAARLPDGRPFSIATLPPPDPLLIDGIRMPASYANFLVTNGVVIVPQYGAPQDSLALEVIGDLFPDRTAVPIDCSRLIWGRGAIHCISQQIPEARTHLSL